MTGDDLNARMLAAKVSKFCAHGHKVLVEMEPGVVLVIRDGVSPACVAWYAGYLAQAGRSIASIRRTRGTAWRAFRELLGCAHADLESLSSCRDMTRRYTREETKSIHLRRKSPATRP
ncbi:MAG: hypothetical protein ACTS3F_09180 [Phycisphaerales bacterium]